MFSAADVAALRRLVDTGAFARGRAYAAVDTVFDDEWSRDGSLVMGEVQGSVFEPYHVVVSLSRSRTKELNGVHGSCTCPVSFNCKHVVALLLANADELDELDETVSAGDRRPSEPGNTSDWEAPLRSLLGERAPYEVANVGLHFEVVGPADSPRRSFLARGARVRLRPVTLSRAGNWTKSSLTWSNLDYYGYPGSLGANHDRVLGVFQEIFALSRTSNHRSYYYDSDVWLEKINSRRLWDVLRESQELGIPLLSSTRPPRHLGLVGEPATFSLDVTRSPSSLTLRARLDIPGVVPASRSALLLGSPAHGIALWDDVTSTPKSPRAAEPSLYLAALNKPLDEATKKLLEGDTIIVPATDEARFLVDLYPSLAERIAVVSSDESVSLPELASRQLVLNVEQTDSGGESVALAWMRGRAGTSWREPLWNARPLNADERDALEAITSVLAGGPPLFETTVWGERLAASVELLGMDAVRFVAETLTQLEAIPGLVIECSNTLPAYHESFEIPSVSLNGSTTSDGDWLDLSVEVRVGDERVPFHALFMALAEEHSHLILPSGTYFSLDRDELRQLAQLIVEARALRDAPTGELRLSRFQAGLWEDFARLGVLDAQATQWEESVRALSHATEVAERPVPEALQAILRPYQRAGFNWLAFLADHGLGGVLADDMGLGKTLEVLTFIASTKERGEVRPYLVIAPTSVVENWALECRRFVPSLRVGTVRETERRRGVALGELVADLDVVITSYALFRLEYSTYETTAWAGLIIDEAQFAKNRLSKTYQCIKSLPVPFKVGLTGTPMENNLMELWSLMSITAPGLFAGPDRFEQYYRTPIEKYGDTERLEQLRRRLRPLLLRRTKEQVAADLPEKQEQILELELNTRHRRLYQTYLARERQKVLGLLDDVTKHRFQIFRSLTLLRQASLDLSLIDEQHAHVPSSKLDVLMEMLDEIVADGHRVLIFSQFTRYLSLVRQRVRTAGIEHCYLDGRTRKRDAVIAAFRNGDAPVFLISLKAGGLGLTLTEADYCVILDPWWNPAVEAQAVDRAHRIGQTRKVMVYRLVAKDTIEEKVMELKTRKSALFNSIIDSGGLEAAALTASDIRVLVS